MNDQDEEMIRAKGAIDGAETLTDAALALRGLADTLEAMEAEGWRLVSVVYDDYGTAVRKK